MQIPLAKLKAVLRYFCENTHPQRLGKVKLMKLFYFLDFTNLKRYGSPVTFDTYVNLEHGPIPSVIKNLVDNVEDDPENAILGDTIRITTPEGMRIKQVSAFKKFSEQDEGMFTPAEMEVMREVSARFFSSTAEEVKLASHEEAPWKMTNHLDNIPYNLAAEDPDCKFKKEEIDLVLSLC